MTINFLNSVVLSSKWRFAIALLAMLVATWCALTPGAAQSRNQRRLTSIQIGEVSEGSRVTIGSDSALNDYEAFRRGDRFYVRIPLAEFIAGKPAFRSDGFEDVQVQKVGDSVVVSFKLQPGVTARVDQRSNRLDIIFSVPNKIARSNRTTGDSNRGTYIPTDGIVRLRNPQTLPRRDAYAAGPIPPGSPQVTRDRVVVQRASGFQTPNSQPATSLRKSTRRVNNRPAGNSGATDSEPSSSVSRRETSSSVSKSTPTLSTSKSEPSPTVLPSTSPGYPALTSSSTPAVPVASQPAVKSPALGVSQNGKPWSDVARQWVSTHRQASLLGALALLCVLVFLAALLFRRRKNVVTANRSGATLAQPKPATDFESNSPSAGVPVNSLSSNKGSSELVNKDAAGSGQNKPTPVAVPNVAANVQPTDRVQANADRGRLVPEKAMARTAVAAPQNQSWVPTNRSTGSSADEDQEREVFEL